MDKKVKDAGAGADAMRPQACRVVRVRRELGDTVTLELVAVDGGERAGFLPGQFNMLYAFGVGEVPISISGEPDGSEVWVHTIRDVGAVSGALCAVRRGDVIGVRGPFGTGWPVDGVVGDDVVFIAGGLGLAPLRPAFYEVLARRREFGRVTLMYGARSPAEILYGKELMRWRGQFGLDVEVTVDRGGDNWYGPVGVVTRLLAQARFDPGDTAAFLCGPEIMMRFAVRELERLGVARERIFVSLERNMKCGIGLCGHCQLMPHFVCKDGPVYRYSDVDWLLRIREA